MKIRQIQQIKAWVALGLGCLIHLVQILSGTLFVAKDFEELKNEKKVETYNWELSEKIFPYIQPICLILLYGRFLMFFAYFLNPQIARTYCVFAVALQLPYNMYPLDAGDVRGRVFFDSLYILFVSLFTSTDFHVSLVTMLLAFLSIHHVAVPIMYTDEVLSIQQISDKLIIQFITIFFFIAINCLITLLGNLLAQNRKRTEECISLLNWI